MKISERIGAIAATSQGASTIVHLVKSFGPKGNAAQCVADSAMLHMVMIQKGVVKC